MSCLVAAYGKNLLPGSCRSMVRTAAFCFLNKIFSVRQKTYVVSDSFEMMELRGAGGKEGGKEIGPVDASNEPVPDGIHGGGAVTQG